MRTHCKRGHSLTPENLFITKRHDGSPHRMCRICRNASVNAALTARYRNDPEFRERQKASARARWHNTRKHKAKTNEQTLHPQCQPCPAASETEGL